MLSEKKVARSGGITIPQHIRRELGIQGGDKIAVEVVGQGDILLRRITGSCIMCGNTETACQIQGKYLCRSCMEQINTQYQALRNAIRKV